MGVVIALVLAAASAGCAGAAGRSAGPPGWFPNGDRAQWPPEVWLVGIGVCGPETPLAERASCAAHRARRELAFSIRSEVEASVRMHTESARELAWGGETRRSGTRTTGREVEQVTDAGAVRTALEMHNVEPREVSCDDGHCYALVAVQRREIAARVAREIATDELRLEGMLAEAERADTLRAIQLLSQARALAVALDRAGMLHQSLTGLNPLDPPAGLRVHRQTRARLSEASVCFVSALEEVPASEVFARPVERMRELGFGAVRTAATEADCGDTLLLFRFEGAGELRWARTTISEEQPVTMEFTGRVLFSVPPQGEQVSRRLTSRGMHVSTTRAVDAATAHLSETIEAFVEEVLAEGAAVGH